MRFARTPPARIASAAVAIAVGALVVATPARGEVIGATGLSTFSPDTQTCGALADCTYIQRKLPGGETRAPFSGRITKWRSYVSIPGDVQLVTAKRLDTGAYKVLRTSEVHTVTEVGLQKFPATLRIKKRQFIGMTLDGDAGIRQFDEAAALRLGFVPAIAPGTSDTPDKSWSNPSRKIALNATIRR